MRARRILLCLFVVFVTLGTKPVAADGDWLDDDQASWNEAGMAVPAAPSPPVIGDERCQELVRPAETREDVQVTARGWRLYGDYRRGWDLALVGGSLNFDAMCRPVPYQQFVFYHGVFVGTLAPDPMFPRSDGALTDARISGDGTVYAIYERYAATDPLCCPSGKAFATFELEQTSAGPVLRLKSAYTNFATATTSSAGL